MKTSKFLFSGLIASVFILLFVGLKLRAGDSAETGTGEGTLAYHLATNAAARITGPTHGYYEILEFTSPPGVSNSTQLIRFTNAVWSDKFWLKNVTGLCATPIGFTNVLGGQGLPTMVSPRHYLCATHMHCESYCIAFLDTNNQVFWRRVLERIELTNDTTVGILDRDLPPSVGFLPVLPANFTNYLPTANNVAVQGIGMNQDFCLFGEPMNFAHPIFATWNSAFNVPNGLGTNWNVTIRAGDSSNPAMLLIGNQLVLVSHNYFVNGGPNYAYQLGAINAAMHQLSKKHHAGNDYQLTEYSLAGWPTVR